MPEPVDPRTGKQAFTLVEVMVVVVIIGVLIGLVLPAYQKMRIKALGIASASNLRQLTIANMNYAADNGTFVPSDDYWNNLRWCGARRGNGSAYDPTKGLLADYLGKDRRVTPCPLFTAMLEAQGKGSSFELGSGGYGYNDYIGGAIASNYTEDIYRLRMATPPSRVRRPTNTVMFGTSALARAEGVQEYPFLHPPYWTDEYGSAVEFYGRPSPSLHFRFDGKAIVSWCDGHISFEKLEPRDVGYNPYGGNAKKEQLGWFGPDKDNGYWNPDYDPTTH